MTRSRQPTSALLDAPEPEPVERTLADAAYRRLAEDIVAGRLAPDARLRFAALRRDYALGLSPLREALQRLASEGWVEAEGHVGFRVAPVSLADLKDITALRVELEPRALRESVRAGGLEWETALVAAAHRLARMPIPKDPAAVDADRWENAHQQFHDALIAACPSPRLLGFCRQLFAQFRRYRRYVLKRYWSSNELRTTIDAEHRAVLDAALRRDPERAAKRLANHYAGSHERVIAGYLRVVQPAAKERPRRAKG